MQLKYKWHALDICENYVREVHQFPRFNSNLLYFADCIGRRIFSGSDTSLVTTFYFNDEYTLFSHAAPNFYFPFAGVGNRKKEYGYPNIEP